MIEDKKVRELEETARQIRIEIVKMIHKSGSGHPGGALSATDIVTALYFHEMRIDPQKPDWPKRDRFILSKGHCCPVVYAAMALRGYYDCCNLNSLRRFKSILQGHPCMNKTPGLDMVSGSLGNGLSLGIGMALGGKLDGEDYRVFIMMGDGELQEGMVWEALMARKLDGVPAESKSQCTVLIASQPILPAGPMVADTHVFDVVMEHYSYILSLPRKQLASMDDLDQFRYLWDGTEPDWYVQRIHDTRWTATYKFAATGPTLKEVISLRSLVEEFTDLPMSEVWKQLRGQEQYEARATMGNIEAHALPPKAERLGLRVELTSRAEDAGKYPFRRMEVL